MEASHKGLLAQKAPYIKEVWLDVDGVMTRQQALAIYDVSNQRTVMFERRDGVECVILRPCDKHGEPIENAVEYLASIAGEPIFEGYRFDTRDGRVIETAVWAGIPVYFISGRNSPCVLKRAINLGATPFLGEKDKVVTIERESGCSWEEILFIGDGFQDVEALRKAGISACPADGDDKARETAMLLTEAKGGEGAVHEVLQAFFKARGIKPK